MRTKNMRLALVLLIAWFALAFVSPTGAQIVTNGSFEAPLLSPYTIQNFASIPGWTFYGGGGLCTQAGVTRTPDGLIGSQFAFLHNGSASMRQTISLPTNGTGTYTLTYLVAGRHDGGSSYQGNVTYNVMLDSAVVLLNARTTSSDYPVFSAQTVSFSAAPGNHVLTFTNAPVQLDSDDMEFFDAIQVVNGAPPPNLITNGSFEFPIVPTGNYEYSTQSGFNGNGWSYSANGSGVVFSPAFNSENAVAGSQIAFLQNASAAIWQTVFFPTNGTYNLTYYFAGRFHIFAEPFGGDATGTVLLDSTILATNTTISADPSNPNQPFAFKSIMFTATAGSHVLTFSNSPTVVSDNTMFLDDVQIVQVAPMTVAAYAGLQIHGSLGTNYMVEFASALPAGSWKPVGNVMISNNSSFFVDTTNAGIPGSGFYTCTAPAPAQAASLGIDIYTGYNLQSVAGRNYLLQYLNPLATAWITITNIITPTSPFLWVDSGSHGKPSHTYYRAALLP
jgi:hypothetical protein